MHAAAWVASYQNFKGFNLGGGNPKQLQTFSQDINLHVVPVKLYAIQSSADNNRFRAFIARSITAFTYIYQHEWIGTACSLDADALQALKSASVVDEASKICIRLIPIRRRTRFRWVSM